MILTTPRLSAFDIGGSSRRFVRLPLSRLQGGICAVQRPDSKPAMDPVQKARQRMGYKNKWSRYDVDMDSQVVWDEPMKKDPHVAIIGGGMSGLACAMELKKQGIRSTVFDTGARDVGGRMASRATADKSFKKQWMVSSDVPQSDLLFDHAAQFFTATDPYFAEVVQQWEADGLVSSWDGEVVGTLDGASGEYKPMPSSSPKRWIAKEGMKKLAADISKQLVDSGLVEVRRPLWVSKLQAVKGKGWQLLGEKKEVLGTYDVVVIAHNGKCANRLVGPSGAPLVAKQLMKLKLSAVWAMMVAFEEPLPVGFEGAFIKNSPVLSWAGNNTAKMHLKHNHPGLQCWTLFSTNSYGQANKVPQERIPPDVHEKVAQEMLAALASAANVPELPKASAYRLQLWGAALPINTPGVDCILDPDSRVGVVGDWLTGGSIQAASASGFSLARQLANMRGKDAGDLSTFRIGLELPFKLLGGVAEIGEFPGITVPGPSKLDGAQAKGGQYGNGSKSSQKRGPKNGAPSNPRASFGRAQGPPENNRPRHTSAAASAQ